MQHNEVSFYPRRYFLSVLHGILFHYALQYDDHLVRAEGHIRVTTVLVLYFDLSVACHHTVAEGAVFLIRRNRNTAHEYFTFKVLGKDLVTANLDALRASMEQVARLVGA